MAERPLPADRLPVDRLLLGAEAEEGRLRRASRRWIPKLLETYEKLGIPLRERAKLAGVAVDAVFDSVSVATTFKGKLEEVGVIFCSFSEAVQKHPDLVRKYLGSVVPVTDNYFAALNSAVFSDGSFCYIPKGVRCPMELSTYFRINSANTGQFERTLIIAEEGSTVSYLEGCTAPIRDENQLHAAVVELVAHDNAQIKYSTVQNWYPGDKDGKGGIYNFVTKRGKCLGVNSKISWTQVETGSAITWKYPSCLLVGDNSVGEFYSVAGDRPEQWAQAQNNLAIAYLGRMRGDVADNQEKAIACLQAALTVFTRDATPQLWAQAQHNLGKTYADRVRGERASNRQKAVASFKAGSHRVYPRCRTARSFAHVAAARPRAHGIRRMDARCAHPRQRARSVPAAVRPGGFGSGGAGAHRRRRAAVCRVCLRRSAAGRDGKGV